MIKSRFSVLLLSAVAVLPTETLKATSQDIEKGAPQEISKSASGSLLQPETQTSTPSWNPLSTLYGVVDSMALSSFDYKINPIRAMFISFGIASTFAGVWYILHKLVDLKSYTYEWISGIKFKIITAISDKHLTQHLVDFVWKIYYPLGICISYYAFRTISKRMLKNYLEKNIEGFSYDDNKTAQQNLEESVILEQKNKDKDKDNTDHIIEQVKEIINSNNIIAVMSQYKDSWLPYLVPFIDNTSIFMFNLTMIFSCADAFFALSPFIGSASITIPGLSSFALSRPISLMTPLQMLLWCYRIKIAYNMYYDWHKLDKENLTDTEQNKILEKYPSWAQHFAKMIYAKSKDKKDQSSAKDSIIDSSIKSPS